MRDTIEDLFRMYKVELNDGLLDALVLLVDHEKFVAKHEAAIETINKVRETLLK